MVKFYLAASYARLAEMRERRCELQALGHSVTSSWLDLHQNPLPGPCTTEHINAHPEYWARFAENECADIEDAEALVAFTGGGDRGRRHAAFGFALSLSKTMVVIGPREHIFHTHACVLRLDTWDEFLHCLRDAPDTWWQWSRMPQRIDDSDG